MKCVILDTNSGIIQYFHFIPTSLEQMIPLPMIYYALKSKCGSQEGVVSQLVVPKHLNTICTIYFSNGILLTDCNISWKSKLQGFCD